LFLHGAEIQKIAKIALKMWRGEMGEEAEGRRKRGGGKRRKSGRK
jgi:hypothetical protein